MPRGGWGFCPSALAGMSARRVPENRSGSLWGRAHWPALQCKQKWASEMGPSQGRRRRAASRKTPGQSRMRRIAGCFRAFSRDLGAFPARGTRRKSGSVVMLLVGKSPGLNREGPGRKKRRLMGSFKGRSTEKLGGCRIPGEEFALRVDRGTEDAWKARAFWT